MLEAYASLTDRHFDASDLVAASVEIFSIEELRADDRHDVHDVHLVLALDLLDGDGAAEVGSDEDETRAVVEADGRVAIHCAEWDAISDVKRALEARFSEAWDLTGRPRDRDGCFAGWELGKRRDAAGAALLRGGLRAEARRCLAQVPSGRRRGLVCVVLSSRAP